MTSDVDLREYSRVYSQVCVDALDAVRSLDAASFKTHLSDIYPLLTALIRREDKPSELSNALCDLFTVQIGPLLAMAVQCDANEAQVLEFEN